MLINLAIGWIASFFVTIYNDDGSSITVPYWVAWRILGAAVAAGVGAMTADQGFLANSVLAFSAAFIVTEVAVKVKGMMK